MSLFISYYLLFHLFYVYYDFARRVDCDNVDEETEVEPVQDSRSSPFSKRPVSMYERQLPKDDNRPTITHSLYSMTAANHVNSSLPLSEEVKKRTDLVTRRIQELWSVMQEIPLMKDSFVPCAERIRVAVAELVAIFPNVSISRMINRLDFRMKYFIIFAEYTRRYYKKCSKTIEYEYKYNTNRMYKIASIIAIGGSCNN